jgi:hypothetical protein
MVDTATRALWSARDHSAGMCLPAKVAWEWLGPPQTDGYCAPSVGAWRDERDEVAFRVGAFTGSAAAGALVGTADVGVLVGSVPAGASAPDAREASAATPAGCATVFAWTEGADHGDDTSPLPAHPRFNPRPADVTATAGVERRAVLQPSRIPAAAP